jgi:phage shock protein A
MMDKSFHKSFTEFCMAESIFARVSRLLSATVEDAVDRMEQAGGEAVMREAIREADRAIDQVKAEREATMARRLQAARQQKMLTERAEELTTKAKFALDQGRDDLAEAALSRQVDFEAQAKGLDAIQQQAREEERRLDEGLAALGARKRQMDDALQAYLVSRREAARGGDGPTRRPRRKWMRPNRLLIAPWPELGESASPAPTRTRSTASPSLTGCRRAPPSPSGWPR